MGARPQNIKQGPCHQLSSLCTVQPTRNESEEKLRFPEESNVSSANAVPQHVVSIQLGRKGMLLTEVFQDHREIHICEWDRFGWLRIRLWRTFRDCQQSVCNTIRQGSLCICASRLVTVSRNDSCLYDARDDLSITSRENNGTEKLGYVILTKIIFRHWTLVAREVRKA